MSRDGGADLPDSISGNSLWQLGGYCIKTEGRSSQAYSLKLGTEVGPPPSEMRLEKAIADSPPEVIALWDSVGPGRQADKNHFLNTKN